MPLHQPGDFGALGNDRNDVLARRRTRLVERVEVERVGGRNDDRLVVESESETAIGGRSASAGNPSKPSDRCRSRAGRRNPIRLLRPTPSAHHVRRRNPARWPLATTLVASLRSALRELVIAEQSTTFQYFTGVHDHDCITSPCVARLIVDLPAPAIKAPAITLVRRRLCPLVRMPAR